jgi:hypothetical protein
MAAVDGNTLLNTLWVISGRFPVGSFPSNPQEIEDDFRKPFPLGIPKGKSHMGLNLATVPATPRLPSKRSNAQGTFPSTLRANVMLCELWPCPVETTHVLYPHHPVWGAEGLKHFNVSVGSHSYCCTTFLKKVWADHTKVGNCTPNSYARRVERSFLGVHEGYVRPSS